MDREHAPRPVRPGEVAWYVTGRFYAAPDGSLQDAGYFVQVQGIDTALFDGDRSEATALLTFLADPFTPAPFANGALELGLDPEGEFGVYLRRPGASFDDPASFGEGEEVARFRRVGRVLGATVGDAAGAPVLTSDVFSARLVASRPFEVGGRRYDLARLLPHGITQWGTAAPAAAVSLPRYPTVVPFVGSAVAIG